MEQALDQRIRQRAYEIWETVGRPDGDSHQHWLAAERELLATSMQGVVRPVPKKAPSARKTPRQSKLARSRARKIVTG
jgi:hypothetical protein